MTDTAEYADIVLPATTQLEHVDLHKAYGHRNLQYNHAAIPPRGECKSNWDVMRLLAAALGYSEPWLHESAEEALRGVFTATQSYNPHLAGISFEELQRDGTVPLTFTAATHVPFADGRFPTASGKVELRCERMRAYGLDPLPEYQAPPELAALYAQHQSNGTENAVEHDRQPAQLILISGASHHFVSSSLANQPGLRAKEGAPFVELHPDDAAAHGISGGDDVIVANARGWCRLRAVVSADVPVGVAVAPKGHWPRLAADRRNVNWTTPDALADLAGQATFHSNLVTIRRADQ